ncbi:tRNA-splicing endonuclease subunit Sen15 [Gigaspora rosea]|uniref:tRNA-splicing endonuclease subunit Sen15 n=1 Tax=Gigaspora rosea TaxID=44941 RepID=A0A397W0R3_9GLOM|nr:tRNA-splicing endonuclease subunit Sen15 [Gigaspora rosea]
MKLDQISSYCDKYPQEASNLSQVYLDLTTAKSWVEVKVKDIEPLQRCILLGRTSKSDAKMIIIIPCASTEIWTIEKITQLFSQLRKVPSLLLDCDPNNIKSITLAIAFPDSTVVYYKVHDGINPPSDN